VAAVIALLVALGATAATPQAYDAVSDVAQVFAAILKDHLQGDAAQALAERAIDGMLDGLDPWSRRLPASAKSSEAKSISCLEDRGVLRLRIPRFDGEWAGRWLKDCPGLNNDLPVLIDLRGNPGGSVGDALALADLFVAGGTIFIEEQRGQAPQNHVARKSVVRFASLTILVDGITASAAEMVAAALQARGAAEVLGTITRGKTTVQRPLHLSTGSVVLLTTGRLRLPSGQSIDGKGLRPDAALPAEPMRSACLRAGRPWSAAGCGPGTESAIRRIP
jgi:carboxyl-terminal processing protease